MAPTSEMSEKFTMWGEPLCRRPRFSDKVLLSAPRVNRTQPHDPWNHADNLFDGRSAVSRHAGCEAKPLTSAAIGLLELSRFW